MVNSQEDVDVIKILPYGARTRTRWQRGSMARSMEEVEERPVSHWAESYVPLPKHPAMKAVQVASWGMGLVTLMPSVRLYQCASGPRSNFIGCAQNRKELKQTGPKVTVLLQCGTVTDCLWPRS